MSEKKFFEKGTRYTASAESTTVYGWAIRGNDNNIYVSCDGSSPFKENNIENGCNMLRLSGKCFPDIKSDGQPVKVKLTIKKEWYDKH